MSRGGAAPPLVGVFDAHALAEQAGEELQRAGFKADRVTLIARGAGPRRLLVLGVRDADADAVVRARTDGWTLVVVRAGASDRPAGDGLRTYGAIEVVGQPD